jgi:hypothetical protein
MLPNENTYYSDNNRKTMDHLANSLEIYAFLNTYLRKLNNQISCNILRYFVYVIMEIHTPFISLTHLSVARVKLCGTQCDNMPYYTNN